MIIVYFIIKKVDRKPINNDKKFIRILVLCQEFNIYIHR